MNLNHFEYSKGNRKIGTDTIIFNMGSATNCPSKKLGLCQIDKCYAMKAEYLYPQTLPYRNRQESYWLSNDAESIALDLCGALEKHRQTVRFVRVNESGDMHSKECLSKLIQISKIVGKEFPKVVLYTYTHRSDIITASTYKRIPKNLVITCSNFRRKGFNTFKAIASVKVHAMSDIPKHREEILKFADYACVGDCSICGYCKKSHGKVIGVPLH